MGLICQLHRFLQLLRDLVIVKLTTLEGFFVIPILSGIAFFRLIILFILLFFAEDVILGV